VMMHAAAGVSYINMYSRIIRGVVITFIHVELLT
jgi:hypothetical protein